ncbi:unnamed protein product [Rotaria sordida]|uniref:Uncharacterized protein n=1 Tax=Rotaria sordida TaxID=392033 RepID=A0A818W6X2_9BILA|nr:unnamed protein product [Rotaria sordida]CAF3721167.1 unnamed protein product [Rotaria sordida]
MASLMDAQKPHCQPRTVHEYHGHIIGYAAGELIRRVDLHHRTYNQFVRDELDREFYVSILHDEVEARVSPVTRKEVDTSNVFSMDSQTQKKSLSCSDASPLESSLMIFNGTRLHCVAIPSVNEITNARSLVRIYYLLIGNINEYGKKQKRLLSEQTLIEATKNVTPTDEPDRNWYNMSTNFGKGRFQIYSDCFNIFGDGVFSHSDIILDLYL